MENIETVLLEHIGWSALDNEWQVVTEDRSTSGYVGIYGQWDDMIEWCRNAGVEVVGSIEYNGKLEPYEMV